MTPSRSLRFVLAGLLLASASSAAPAQAAPAVRDLPKPVRELDEPYSLIVAVREASRGRLIVADGMDGELSIVDFASGELEPLGRQGSGPGEYRTPSAVLSIRGDTIWALDLAQQRVTVFLPDLKPGVPFVMQMFDTQSRSALTMPFSADLGGRMYASAMPITGGGGQMRFPDSVDVVRFDPRATPVTRTVLGKVRFPTSGTPEMKVEGQVVRYKAAYPGLVAADSWAVFADGRVAIVHGADYSVEFIAPDGKRTTSRPIPYERTPVTAADRTAEMTEARKQLAEQMKAVRRMMPPNITMDIEMTEPETWPATYPALSPMAILAAPDGRLWVKRATPARVGREQWDVISPAGVVVARWRLAPRTRLVGVGAGVVYVVRLDEDDLQYLGRVEVR